MKKKLLTLAMAAVMVVSSAVTAFAADAETLAGATTGTDWWANSKPGANYDLEDGKTISFKVEVVSATDAGNVAFCTEVRDDSKGESGTEVHCIDTAAGDGNAWYYEDGGTKGDEIKKEGTTTKFEAGKTYEVTVSRSGSSYVVKYNNLDGTNIYTMTANNTNLTGKSTVNFVANLGTIKVELVEAQPETQAPTQGSTETTTVAAGGNNNNNNSTGSTGSGDTAPVLALLAVAAVAGAVVVLRKKEVTE